MSNLLDHAKKEFEILGWNDLPEDDMQSWVVANLLELLKVFSEQGHSGSSAPYVVNLFKRLANYGTIAPLTGKDDEWTEVMNGMFQNKRCSEVFKDSKDGQAYWSFGRVFLDGETTFVGRGSKVKIKEFPWRKPEKPKLIHKRWRWLYR